MKVKGYGAVKALQISTMLGGADTLQVAYENLLKLVPEAANQVQQHKWVSSMFSDGVAGTLYGKDNNIEIEIMWRKSMYDSFINEKKIQDGQEMPRRNLESKISNSLTSSPSPKIIITAEQRRLVCIEKRQKKVAERVKKHNFNFNLNIAIKFIQGKLFMLNVIPFSILTDKF